MDKKVQIKKRFKNTMTKRFNPDSASCNDEYCWIRIKCALCAVYGRGNTMCGKCPFAKFETSKMLGCAAWANRIFGKHNFIDEGIRFGENAVRFYNNNKWRKKMLKFAEKAEEFIEWI